jgi:hypothetical protein
MCLVDPYDLLLLTPNVAIWLRIFTATPATNGGKWRHSAALSELGPPFLNGVQRSVNRKVQGSNPCSGAKSEFDLLGHGHRSQATDSNRIATG